MLRASSISFITRGRSRTRAKIQTPIPCCSSSYRVTTSQTPSRILKLRHDFSNRRVSAVSDLRGQGRPSLSPLRPRLVRSARQSALRAAPHSCRVNHRKRGKRQFVKSLHPSSAITSPFPSLSLLPPPAPPRLLYVAAASTISRPGPSHGQHSGNTGSHGQHSLTHARARAYTHMIA